MKNYDVEIQMAEKAARKAAEEATAEAYAIRGWAAEEFYTDEYVRVLASELNARRVPTALQAQAAWYGKIPWYVSAAMEERDD